MGIVDAVPEDTRELVEGEEDHGADQGVGRRTLLRRSAAAVVGLLVADRVAAGTEGPALAWPPAGDAVLELTATDTRGRVVGRPPGSQPRDGDQLLVTATLELDGVAVGELHATSVHVARSGFHAQPRAASTQHHVFHLDDGTIVGLGSADHDDRPDELAVVGGTGRFARATGTYRVLLRPRGLGGDGTATFTFDLTLQEGRDAP